MTIRDAEPPAAGIYRGLQRIRGTTQVATHNFRPRRDKPDGTAFFVHTGQAATNHQYPHVSVMITGALFQRAGLLFFSSNEFHVSLSDSYKLFYSVVDGMYQRDRGQGSLLGLDTMAQMADTFIRMVRRDITAGITPERLAQGRRDLAPEDSYGQPIWVREQAERQAVENDQGRLRQIVRRQDEAWASQFEWPDAR